MLFRSVDEYLTGALHTNTIQANTGSVIAVNSNLNIGSNYITQNTVRQPFVQYGSSNTGTSSSGTTVTFPVSYYSPASYVVQLTYNGNPSGNQPLYVITRTSTYFTFHGANSCDVFWTAMGDK